MASLYDLPFFITSRGDFYHANNTETGDLTLMRHSERP